MYQWENLLISGSCHSSAKTSNIGNVHSNSCQGTIWLCKWIYLYENLSKREERKEERVGYWVPSKCYIALVGRWMVSMKSGDA